MVQHLRRHRPEVVSERGDLISLINGSFFSTGVSVHAALRTLPVVAMFEEAYLHAIDSQQGAQRTQLSVSLRDAAPVLDEVHRALQQFGQAIEHRLTSPSANPLFVFSDDGVSADSQSSFLDFGLTSALRRMQSAVLLMISTWHRIILHTSDSMAESMSPETAPVQPPKIAQAVVERAHLRATNAPRFGGDDSHGIEDLRDGSLLQVEVLNDLLDYSHYQQKIWESLLGLRHSELPPGHVITRAARHMLGEHQEKIVLDAVAAVIGGGQEVFRPTSDAIVVSSDSRRGYYYGHLDLQRNTDLHARSREH